MSIVSKDIDDIAYVYEQFIAPKKLTNLGPHFIKFYRIFFTVLVDINFLVVILFYLYSGQQMEYLFYGVVMVVHFLRINLSSLNFHDVYTSVTGLSSSPSE